MISRCSSPMPAMIVCPVSSSVRTRKDGSSTASLREARDDLVLVRRGLRLDGDVDDGSGNSIRSRMIGLLVVAERVARGGAASGPRPRRCRRRSTRSISSLLVGAHLHQPADALALALHRVPDRRARLELARVDAQEGERRRAKRVGHDLERERAERRLVVASRATRPRPSGSLPCTGGMSSGRRQVVDHRVEQRLHALVLERRAAEHREELQRDAALADGAANLVLGELACPRGTSPSARRPARPTCSSSLRAVLVGLSRELLGDVDDRRSVLPSSASWKTSAFIRTRSMTPRCFSSAPRGSWMTHGVARRASRGWCRPTSRSRRRRGPSC